MEFVAAALCVGKQLRLDRTIRGLVMFGNCYKDHNTFNIITILFLTNSNFAAEVASNN